MNYCDVVASDFYRIVVKNWILSPCGVSQADVSPIPFDSDKQTLYYPSPLPQPSVPGGSIGDWTLISGGGGWFISTRDLAAFWAHLRFGTVVSGAVKKLLFPSSGLSCGLGVGSVKGGLSYFRNGDLRISGAGAGCYALLSDLPGGVQLALTSNQRVSANPGGAIGSLISQAYGESWV